MDLSRATVLLTGGTGSFGHAFVERVMAEWPDAVVRVCADNPFAEFICTSGYIEDNEDGPSFCRRVLAAKTAAE